MMKYPLSIRLGERQSAEPNTCGSCGYYSRPTEGCRGNCNFKMPPWIMLLHTHDNGDHCIEEDQDEMAEAEMNCGMGKDGQCSQAGTEYCDWNCPFSR